MDVTGECALDPITALLELNRVAQNRKKEEG